MAGVARGFGPSSKVMLTAFVAVGSVREGRTEDRAVAVPGAVRRAAGRRRRRRPRPSDHTANGDAPRDGVIHVEHLRRDTRPAVFAATSCRPGGAELDAQALVVEHAARAHRRARRGRRTDA